nr:hypothetical protein [Nocardia terpenica]
MLADGGWDGALDEVDLLVASIQPGAFDSEVGAVGSLGQAQYVDVEVQSSVDISHIDRNVV